MSDPSTDGHGDAASETANSDKTPDELLAELADDFAERCRRGERPSIEEYVRNYPALAADLGDMLPALEAIEQPGLERISEVMPAMERPGSVIGRYKLLEQIGEGGFGVVYMAEQQHPVRRKLALKVIKPGMDTRQVIARFEAERQALALMDHPNIAKVLDAGATDSGRPYFVMELVPGVPITDFCDRQRLPPRERLELFVQVCQAVQHAHTKGVIHRDIKPSNVLVAVHDDRPVPKVIDFGVAKAIGQQLTEKTLFTNFAQMVGTPLYMSPEQAQMGGLDVDTRTDVYGLGVLLYELLTASTPFDRRRLGQAAQDEMRRIIREEEPPRPSTRLSTSATLPTIAATRGLEPQKLSRIVKGELDWIVMKAMDKDRSRRYETANGLAMDLQRYLANEPVLACPPSSSYRLRKFVRRNKGPVLAACLVLLGLVGGIVGATWGLVRASAARSIAVGEAKQKEVALRNAAERLWWSLYERARAGRFSRQAGQRLDSLNALAQAARIRPDERLRDEAIAAMALPDVRRVPMGTPLPIGSVVAYGGSRRICARADTEGKISIRSVGNDQEIRQIAAGRLGPGCCLYFSPDERYLHGLGEGFALHIWRVDDGQPALRDTPRPCWAHSFSPDGRRVAVGQNDQVLFFDLLTGEEVTRWRMPGHVNALAFHPDGTRLAVGYTKSNVASVYDVASGTLLTDLPVGRMGAQVVAWHPDGQRLAIGGTDPRIQIWNVASKRKVATLEGHTSHVTAVPFHGEGDLLASPSWDGVLRLWECATGRPLLQVPMATVGRPRFGVDGRWPAAGLQGDYAEVLEVIPSREYRTLVSSAGAGSGGYRHYADISPDGRFLAVGMNDGARLWDLAGGREVATLPAGTIFAFFESTPTGDKEGALLTGGTGGLCRWPLTLGGAGPDSVLLGQPRKLSDLGRAWFARGPDDRVLGVATEEGGPNQIIDLATGAVQRDLGAHPNGEVMALSPDGRWAASSGWHSDLVRLWDAGSGKVVREWVVGQKNYVYFTPDSSTLIISHGDAYAFYDVKTLRIIHRFPRDVRQFPGHVAFSPDGRLMALEMAPGVMHLKEAATGRTVARLTDPHGDRASWQGFTPDGAKLVVVARDASAIHIWDLRIIRQRLKEMKLDWDWPELPPLVPAPSVSGGGADAKP